MMKGSLCRAGYLLVGILGIVALAGCPPVQPVTTVTVTPDTADLEVDQTISLSADSTNSSDASFDWSSSDENVVMVEQTEGTDITVRAVAPGTATISATGSVSGVAGTALITVPEEEVEPGTIQPALLAPGFNVSIQSVAVPADRKPVVTFTATNNKGQTIARSEIASLRFILARLTPPIPGDSPKFASYTTSANGQATYDSAQLNGLTQAADGTFTYKFNAALPVDYDPSVTHELGGQMARLYAIDNLQYPANPIFKFRPDGGTAVGRDVIPTETCNKCHTRLEFHGGQRREMQLCILCHSPQSIDPESGNTVDMTQMIHKIHMGEELPSVQQGVPYQIIGHQNHAYDYSHIAFSQRIANCEACHDEDAAEQGDAFLNHPTIEACGACHDRTWFGNPQQTPQGYTNHPFNFESPDSSHCADCHQPAFIRASHAKPTDPGMLMDVLNVAANPETGTVNLQFQMTYGDGTPITDVTSPDRVGAIIAWPTTDFQNHISETLGGARAITGAIDTYTSETGIYNYTFKTTLPTDSTDTFAIALTGRVPGEDNNGEEIEIGTSSNGYTIFTLDGSEPVARREVVDEAKCDACHDEIRFHGEQRFGVEVCLMCHRPNLSEDGTTVNFKEMLHYVHTGGDLENGYEFAQEVVHFPGKREQCTMCHLSGTFGVPLPDEALPTLIGEDLIPAARAACTSCHDSTAADVHAFVNSNAQGVESCAVCHGASANASVANVHALLP